MADVSGSSPVECQTCNRESPGSNPPFATVSKFGHFRYLHDDQCWFSAGQKGISAARRGETGEKVFLP